jgi:hypothetical protein
LGFHASRILCLDLDSSRTGAFGNEVDVVQVHTLYISWGYSLINELDRIGHAERVGLRTEIFQKVAQVDVRNNGSVGDKFVRLAAAVGAVAASEPDNSLSTPQ